MLKYLSKFTDTLNDSFKMSSQTSHSYYTRSKSKTENDIVKPKSPSLKKQDRDDSEDSNQNIKNNIIQLILYNVLNKMKKNSNKKRKLVLSSDSEDEEENMKNENQDNDEDDKNQDKNKDNDEENNEDDEDDDYEDDDDDPIILDEDDMYKAELIEKIESSSLPMTIKEKVIEIVENSHDVTKIKEWANNVLKIPFGKYVSLPVSMSSEKKDIIDFFKKAKQILDNVVYGMDNVKEEMLNYIAQFVSNKDSRPRVLALHGKPGCGKTAIIRKGLSNILNRPIKCISMGGINDSATFNGFEYTYVGSKCGIISRSIIDCGVMNPIIYMDELDKISGTPAGEDVMNFLIHITDPEQAMTFEDKYFQGIDIDLSKVLFVFSFNDETKISPILLDRLNVVTVNSPTIKEKIVIAKDYILKDVCKNIGFPFDELEITEQAIRNIVSGSSSDGLRDIKRKIETIIMKINTIKLTDGEINFSFSIKPKEIQEEHIVKINGRKKLRKLEVKTKKIFVIDEDKIRKLYNDVKDDVSYKMMFI